MAKIGEGLWFDLDLDDSKFKSKIDEVKKQVQSLTVNSDLKFNTTQLESSVRSALQNATKNMQVTLDEQKISAAFQNAIANSLKKSAQITADPATLVDSIKNALKGKTFKIDVKADKLSLKGEITEVTEKVKDTNKHLEHQSRLVKQLKSAFLAYFSVSAAKDFLNKIIEIGGEIEKQKLALASIIGDGSLSERLYGQLRDLSMISPFDVQDIMKYSKQLKAFGIQYSDLYDTTKRLADIAAGVGVDFGRIAYEFGQTSARKLQSAA